jgi:hypothetical protein
MIYSAIGGYFYYIVGIAKNIRQWSEKLRVLYHDLTDVFWWWQEMFWYGSPSTASLHNKEPDQRIQLVQTT